MTVRVRFIPQVWVQDYALEIDPEGISEFDIPEDDAKDMDGNWLVNYDGSTDHLRYHANAPAWMSEYSGPFEVEIDPFFLMEQDDES